MMTQRQEIAFILRQYLSLHGGGGRRRRNSLATNQQERRMAVVVANEIPNYVMVINLGFHVECPGTDVTQQ